MGRRRAAIVVRKRLPNIGCRAARCRQANLVGCRDLLSGQNGYDVVILSDLLHYQSSHDELVRSVSQLLGKQPGTRAYVGAGKYTSSEVSSNFLMRSGC